VSYAYSDYCLSGCGHQMASDMQVQIPPLINISCPMEEYVYGVTLDDVKDMLRSVFNTALIDQSTVCKAA
jgi:hypothetical protein